MIKHLFGCVHAGRDHTGGRRLAPPAEAPDRQEPQTGTAGGAAEVYATQSDSGIVGNDTIL